MAAGGHWLCLVALVASSVHASHQPPIDDLRNAALQRDAFEQPVTLPTVGDVTLQLRRFDIVSPDTRFITVRDDGSSERAPEPDEFVFVRGVVRDVPGSHVFMSLRPNVFGRIELGPGAPVFEITGSDGALNVSRPSDRLLISSPAAAGAPGCGCEDRAIAPTTRGTPAPLITSRPTLLIELGVDTDLELRELFDSNEETLNFVVELHAVVADVSIRDLNTNYVLTRVRTWETPDPFDQIDPTLEIIQEWSPGGSLGDVPRDIAHLVSGRRNLPFSGLALYIGGVCNQDLGFAWSGYIQGVPLGPGPYKHDASLIAHELGHILGAPHTHAVSIDSCPFTDASPQRGTIMSYCSHPFTGEWANMDLRYHRRIQAEWVEPLLTDRDCIGADCNLNAIDDATEIGDGTAADADGNGVIDACEDCDQSGTLDSADVIDGGDANENLIVDACEVDCDGDGVPDVADDTTDVNGNRLLDACETDCNANGIADTLDIDADFSQDLDRNGVLDACQDCDGDGVPDLDQLSGANEFWITDAGAPLLRRHTWLTGVETASSNQVVAGASDVVHTPEGVLLVSSTSDGRIVELDADGVHLRDLASRLVEPMMMLVDGADVIVVDVGSSDVLRVNRATGATRVLYELDTPWRFEGGIAMDEQRRLYLPLNDGRVLRVHADTEDALDIFIEAAHNGGLQQARDLHFLPNGDLLIASFGTNAILRYDGQTGAFLGTFDRIGSLTLDQPFGIEADDAGNIYVTRYNVIAPDETNVTRLRRPRIYQLDPQGRLVRVIVQGSNTRILHPTAITFMPDNGMDCNRNMVIDGCELDAGADDTNENGKLDECEPAACLLDVDGDSLIGIADLLAYVDAWLRADASAEVTNGLPPRVDILDLLLFIEAWLAGSPVGLCP